MSREVKDIPLDSMEIGEVNFGDIPGVTGISMGVRVYILRVPSGWVYSFAGEGKVDRVFVPFFKDVSPQLVALKRTLNDANEFIMAVAKLVGIDADNLLATGIKIEIKDFTEAIELIKNKGKE